MLCCPVLFQARPIDALHHTSNYKVHRTHNIYIYLSISIRRILHSSMVSVGLTQARPNYTALYYIVMYCTVVYYTVMYCTVVYYTKMYCTVVYYTILYCTVVDSTVLYCSVQHMYPSEVSYLPISHSITEHNDPVWKVVIDLVVVLVHTFRLSASSWCTIWNIYTLGVVPGVGGGWGSGRRKGEEEDGFGDIE